MKKPSSPVVSVEEVEMRISYWYEHKVEMGLHEFLGWTREQLVEWNKTQKIPVKK